jgi:hypothetical protein
MSGNGNGNSGSDFPKKIAKLLPAGFREDADALSNDSIKEKIIEYERSVDSTEKDMEADIKLNDAKDLVKELGKDYRDVIKMNRAMIKYLVFMMDSRGV